MALPQIVARNTTQKIPTTDLNSRTTLQPNTYYTCPTGKKAFVKGTCVCDSLGSAANAQLVLAGLNDARWVTTGSADINVRDDLAVDLTVGFEVQLAAGEIVQTIQSSGTNAVFQIFATIQESAI